MLCPCGHKRPISQNSFVYFTACDRARRAAAPRESDVARLDPDSHTSVDIGYGDGQSLRLETGEIGRLAAASVMLTAGDTMLYTTVCHDREPKGDGSFIPLQVIYQERLSAGGRTLCVFHPLILYFF